MRVMALLAERQGQAVTREELKKHLWPEDTFVDFETGLNTAVSKLRGVRARTRIFRRDRLIETGAVHPQPLRFLAMLVPVTAGTYPIIRRREITKLPAERAHLDILLESI